MPSYNVQKRRRLDNITEKHNRNMRRVIKGDLEARARDIFEQLNAGVNFFQGGVKNLRNPTDKIYDDHEFDTVRSGLSDGIQEVTPNNELGLWRMLPDNSCPIITLDQFHPHLAKKRDQMTEKAIKKMRKRHKFTLINLRNLTLDTYLGALKGGYRSLSSDWVSGEGSITDVLSMLSLTFGKTDAETKRIFRTETTSYFNETRADYFIDETEMDFMQIFAITDGRISDICEDRNRWVFPILEARQRKKSPSFHPHCRTIQRPLTSRLASHRRLIKIGLQFNESSFTPLPKNWA